MGSKNFTRSRELPFNRRIFVRRVENEPKGIASTIAPVRPTTKRGCIFYKVRGTSIRVSFIFFPERERRWNDQSELPAALSNSRFQMTPAAHKFCIFFSLSSPHGARLVGHTLVAKYCAGGMMAINDRRISSVRIIDVPVATIAS